MPQLDILNIFEHITLYCIVFVLNYWLVGVLTAVAIAQFGAATALVQTISSHAFKLCALFSATHALPPLSTVAEAQSHTARPK